MDAESISDDTIKFMLQVLASKLFRKSCKDHIAVGITETTKKCVEAVHMNWEIFLVNKFLEDCRDEHDKGTTFHYAWLFILLP